MVAQKVTGVVSAHSKNKAGNRSYKVGEKWYGDKSTELKADKGDTIEFEFEVNGVFNNIVNGTFNKKSSAQKEETTSSGSSGGGVDWDLKDHKIVLQHSQNVAIETVKLLIQADAITWPAKKEDRAQTVQDMIAHYTEKFYNEVRNPETTNTEDVDNGQDD